MVTILGHTELGALRSSLLMRGSRAACRKRPDPTQLRGNSRGPDSSDHEQVGHPPDDRRHLVAVKRTMPLQFLKAPSPNRSSRKSNRLARRTSVVGKNRDAPEAKPWKAAPRWDRLNRRGHANLACPASVSYGIRSCGATSMAARAACVWCGLPSTMKSACGAFGAPARCGPDRPYCGQGAPRDTLPCAD